MLDGGALRVYDVTRDDGWYVGIGGSEGALADPEGLPVISGPI